MEMPATNTLTKMVMDTSAQIIMDASRMASRMRAIWFLEVQDIAAECAREADVVPLADA